MYKEVERRNSENVAEAKHKDKFPSTFHQHIIS